MAVAAAAVPSAGGRGDEPRLAQDSVEAISVVLKPFPLHPLQPAAQSVAQRRETTMLWQDTQRLAVMALVGFADDGESLMLTEASILAMIA